MSYFWCQAVPDTSRILWAERVLPRAEGILQRLGRLIHCCTSLLPCSVQLCSTWCRLFADSSAVKAGNTVQINRGGSTLAHLSATKSCRANAHQRANISTLLKTFCFNSSVSVPNNTVKQASVIINLHELRGKARKIKSPACEDHASLEQMLVLEGNCCWQVTKYQRRL